MATVIVLDASVLVGFLDGADAHHQRAVDLLAREIDSILGVNALTLADVLVVPARQGRLDGVHEALDELGVTELPFPSDAAVRLAKLRASTALKMPDCCVVLAAEQAGAAVASFDRHMLEIAGARGLETLDS